MHACPESCVIHALHRDRSYDEDDRYCTGTGTSADSYEPLNEFYGDGFITLGSKVLEADESILGVHPGTFECIVAEIFKSAGFETSLVEGGTKRMGESMCWRRSDTLAGEFRIGIQCKRLARTSVVRADVVWALGLHKGVVAATARFEKSVVKDLRRNLWL